MSTGYRRTVPLMRFVLILGAVLTLASGFQLYVLTNHTDEFFAWTIPAGFSAAIMGAFYWTACTLSFLSWRRPTWALARVGVPGVTLFVWLTLITTLIHLDKFHFGGSVTARFAAWAWLVIYIVDPVLITVAWVIQWRSPGEDPPRARDLGAGYRGLLSISAAVLVLLGLTMVAVPNSIVDVTAWPLTPLTSRSIGSWVLAMGVTFVAMAWEDDAERIRPAAIASLVLPALLVIGMARYWSEFTWSPSAWAYIALIADIAVVGAMGIRRLAKPRPVT